LVIFISWKTSGYLPNRNCGQAADLTLQQFRRASKTYLFGWLGLQHLVTFLVCYTNALT